MNSFWLPIGWCKLDHEMEIKQENGKYQNIFDSEINIDFILINISIYLINQIFNKILTNSSLWLQSVTQMATLTHTPPLHSFFQLIYFSSTSAGIYIVLPT